MKSATSFFLLIVLLMLQGCVASIETTGTLEPKPTQVNRVAIVNQLSGKIYTERKEFTQQLVDRLKRYGIEATGYLVTDLTFTNDLRQAVEEFNPDFIMTVSLSGQKIELYNYTVNNYTGYSFPVTSTYTENIILITLFDNDNNEIWKATVEGSLGVDAARKIVTSFVTEVHPNYQRRE
ncbi:hypothetical protein KQI52_14795 [bacterium]|nr:hypothetical protein [bacterium]